MSSTRTAGRSPKISACLLTYNHANIVTESIESALHQTLDDFELILSDDCSTDETWEICQSFARRDPRVKAIRTPRNLGMAGNANFAVSQGTAPYIALLHHDDLCAPTLLERWLDVMEMHADIGFVSNAFARRGATGFSHPFNEWNDGKLILERFVLPSWACPFRGTGLIRRSAWDAVGGVRERFGMLADVDLWMRLSARFAVGYVEEPLIELREERPAYYPYEYSRWNWHVPRLMYEIHGVNRLEYYGTDTLLNKARFTYFRARVSAHILRWLAYAVVKGRWAMIASSSEVSTQFELPVSRWVRFVLKEGMRAARGPSKGSL